MLILCRLTDSVCFKLTRALYLVCQMLQQPQGGSQDCLKNKQSNLHIDVYCLVFSVVLSYKK